MNNLEIVLKEMAKQIQAQQRLMVETVGLTVENFKTVEDRLDKLEAQRKENP